MLRLPAFKTVSVETIIPDGCNIGVVGRTLLLVNVMVFIETMFRINGMAAIWIDFMERAILLEPVCLSSMCVLCVLRRVEKIRLAPLMWQRILCISVPMFVTGMLLHFFAQFDWYSSTFSYLTFGKGLFIAALLSAGIQYYFELRTRAFSPALVEARLQALQARIRPHFLFNSLNAVLSLIRTDPRLAETTLENLADLFRVSMRDNRTMTTLQEEIQLCEQYLSIEKIRLGDRLQVHWDTARISDDVLRTAQIPALLLQPLLENSVHYGVESVVHAAPISVRIARVIDKIEVVVRNAYDQNIVSTVEGNHMALINIRERLILLYDVEAQFSYGVVGDQFEVRLTFPYGA